MYVVSAFEHTVKIEMALTSIEMKGIPKENVLAVPLDPSAPAPALFDRMHSSDSHSLMDFPIILAALFSLLGLIYGFLLAWGPVFWALCGTGIGFGLGLVIKLYAVRQNKMKQTTKLPTVVVMVQCDEHQLQMVQDAMWAHAALGVAKLDID